MSGRLTDGFRDIIELSWADFIEVEKSVYATNFDSIITSIARACSKGNLRAIQTALDRLDGKVAAEIEVEYPKFYTVYPYATMKKDDPSIIDYTEETGLVVTANDPKIVNRVELAKEAEPEPEEELPTGSLRAVLEKMLELPKTQVLDILGAAEEVEKGNLTMGNPKVKSVIVSGLMKLVHDGRISAVFEVFDQIDGKVADKIKILGNDVFVTSFDTIAPANAIKNEKGIYQIESDNMTNVWAARLESGKGGR